ncbi:protein of unknown function [Taphrina deformans PYCC 5710]|uniref:FUN14 family protein n=1 Tax=Taphrina deformans (strain PYCC 5710 / ATCC 11124 / CBS 356.35 / IMI 108563 / JCM 9778 / NBRC 8474) TaxID=1097556 RepID=R4XDF8_TAPDE|nr:protein of unknown function [Taphrina deformans PYCC 5710]|eukprot:CCG82443.1 protein of unknown function [Taphrina deformans PYCC 5710]
MSFARLLVAPSLVATGLMTKHHYRPTTLQCESAASLPTLRNRTDPILDPHQFATGSVLGIAAGLIFKRLGKLFFVIVGGSYLVLRALGSSTVPGLGQIKVPWAQARQFLLNRTSFGERAEKATEVGESPIVTLLTKDLTFKLSFLATFMIGLVNT